MIRRRSSRRTDAFTLTEVLASLVASSIVIGGLIVATTDTRRVLAGSEKYAEAYSAQRRLIDYLARDLRRACEILIETPTGERRPASGLFTLEDGHALVLRLPGYYRAQAREEPGYQEALDVVGTIERLDYGTAQRLADPVEVSFRKKRLGLGSGVGFVRIEAGLEEIIVAGVADLVAEITVSPEQRTAHLRACFRTPYRGIGDVVSSRDEILLRNTPLDFRP